MKSIYLALLMTVRLPELVPDLLFLWRWNVNLPVDVFTPLFANGAVEFLDVLVASIRLATGEADMCSITHFLCTTLPSPARVPREYGAGGCSHFPYVLRMSRFRILIKRNVLIAHGKMIATVMPIIRFICAVVPCIDTARIAWARPSDQTITSNVLSPTDVFRAALLRPAWNPVKAAHARRTRLMTVPRAGLPNETTTAHQAATTI